MSSAYQRTTNHILRYLIGANNNLANQRNLDRCYTNVNTCLIFVIGKNILVRPYQ
ncbi:Uncharacterised protein [Vibrio cholerae]|uniref:Uncharacterized protein n=2 Tax=Vibrio TaxID=662 RepID=A0A655PED8_VIBCL|nr:Uncharacterised protein [Vibrio cholerae]CSA19768.1 Uncharacterised protein [Vibrio cholerae]CSB56655.1 Uncharacterised protein [Vibrio cholerae]CSC29545.1 Uncharacterised protein [Vibrio cholerae]CSC38142.1 Uncharacterised protein [Vibrio cholerae]